MDADPDVALHRVRAFHREHVPVPHGIIVGAELISGSPTFAGAVLYSTHHKTSPSRRVIVDRNDDVVIPAE